MPPFPESHRCLSPFQGNLFSLHCLDFQEEVRLTPRWQVGQSCGKASWESVVGKPRGKATDPLILAKGSSTLLLQLGGKCTCMPHSLRGLTPLGRLQNTPRSMSALERNPQVLAPTQHKVFGLGIHGRGIPRGPRVTRKEMAFPEATRACP